MHPYECAALWPQRRIRSGPPDSNRCVERPQLTTLEECWRPAFARSLAPRSTALERDLDEYLDYFDYDRAHTGRLPKGRIPAEIPFGARKAGTVRLALKVATSRG